MNLPLCCHLQRAKYLCADYTTRLVHRVLTLLDVLDLVASRTYGSNTAHSLNFYVHGMMYAANVNCYKNKYLTLYLKMTSLSSFSEKLSLHVHQCRRKNIFTINVLNCLVVNLQKMFLERICNINITFDFALQFKEDTDMCMSVL